MSLAAARVAEEAARQPLVLVVGNPNTGKSVLFNALTGLRQKVGNYPGVTVEKHLGFFRLGQTEAQLVDLPGLYSLAAHSPDELLALDVLLGRLEGMERPDVVLVVADASNLRRNLFLVTQILELGLPVVVALNLMDAAEDRGIRLDSGELGRRLGARVVPVVATRRRGLDELRRAVDEALHDGEPAALDLVPQVKAAARDLAVELGANGYRPTVFEVERALLDRGGAAEQRVAERLGEGALRRLESARGELETALAAPPAAHEARARYDWIGSVLEGVLTPGPERRGDVSARLDRVAVHPVFGSVIFVALMAVVFQAVFAWAAPLMELIDGAAGALSAAVVADLGEGALASLLADGVIAGVGSVVVFLPQILILFAFILFLEDTGYMARVAFLMDRLMRATGLSGHSFLPMLSSFACAVPGILATRVIPDRRDRLATILAAPFMTCSARLPVYALLIGAFVPDRRFALGLVNLQGLVLLGLYLLGIAGGIVTALVLKRTLLRGPTPIFLMELPPFRRPSLRSVLLRLYERARIFLVRAGTVIFVVAVVVWTLSYFPHPDAIGEDFDAARAAARPAQSGQAPADRLDEIDDLEAAAYLEQSYLGRLGKTVAPVFAPLGWDWKVSSAILAAFPAREVVVAVLGTIYAVGADADENDQGLIDRLKGAERAGGGLVFTLPMVLGLMVFVAFCLQCGATVAAIRRETNSWSWPVFAWVYMTVLAYAGAFVTYRLAGHFLGGA
jgi:ferrous iron transport protein B